MIPSKRKNQGMTLIEILVALSIIAVVSAIALPTITNIFGENIKSSSRKLAGTIKYLFNQAIIKNRTMRLAYDFKTNTYWAEIADEKYLIEDEEEKEFYSSDDDEDKDEDFQQIKTKLIKPRKLDSGVEFKSVYSMFKEEMIEDGRAYTHFFPGGFAEATVIHLESGKKVFSLVIEPMLGMAKIYDYFVDPDFEEE
jgi:general secretion pathway protein H